jgi:hypothetical protein
MTTREELKAKKEQRIQNAYAAVPEFVRDDICEAAQWARDTLTGLEGDGHIFYVYAKSDGTVYCSLSKVTWAADFVGRGMAHGAQAMVMAVCEYLNGG